MIRHGERDIVARAAVKTRPNQCVECAVENRYERIALTEGVRSWRRLRAASGARQGRRLRRARDVDVASVGIDRNGIGPVIRIAAEIGGTQ